MVKEFKEGRKYRSLDRNGHGSHTHRKKGDVLLALSGTRGKSIEYRGFPSRELCQSGSRDQWEEVKEEPYKIY